MTMVKREMTVARVEIYMPRSAQGPEACINITDAPDLISDHKVNGSALAEFLRMVLPFQTFLDMIDRLNKIRKELP